MDIRKVPASSGAEWLLGGFALLRKSPLGLGLLGAIFGVLALAANLAMQGQQVQLAMLLQLVMVLVGPLLVAGMIYAAREVDEGRGATPLHLLRGVQEGKAARLLSTLLPQIIAAVVCVVLLILMIGPTQLQRIMVIAAEIQGQANPDPALVNELPLGKLALWGLIAFVLGILASFFTFTAIPEMMFGDSGALAAMKRSFQVCTRNLGAMIVFFLLLIVAAIALNFAVLLVAVIVKLIAGQQAMQIVAQLLLLAILMPVVTGAMYHAWKQLLGAQTTTAPAASGIEV